MVACWSMPGAISALTKRRSRQRGAPRSARSGTCPRRRPRSTADGRFVLELRERLTHGLDQIERHRRGAALRGKNCGEFEVDARQEAAHDDAAGGKFLRGEGIAN